MNPIRRFLQRRQERQVWGGGADAVAAAFGTTVPEPVSHVSAPETDDERAEAEFRAFNRWVVEERKAAEAIEFANEPFEDIWDRVRQLDRAISHAYTLENTPAAFMNGELEYGTKEGDAPMREDAGSFEMEEELGRIVYEHADMFAGTKFEQYGRDYAASRHESKGLEHG